MIWRRLAPVAVALVTVLAVTCSNVQAKHRVVKGPVIVQLDGWASGKPQLNAFNTVIARFEKEYNYIKVNFTPLSGNVETATQQALLDGNPPDVFQIDEGWMSDFVTKSNHYLQREDTFANHDKGFSASTFNRYLLPGFKTRGIQYVYPTGFGTLGLWYNKALLSAAGLKSAPSTYADFASAACKLTNDTTHVFGASLSADAYHWFPFLGGFGGRVLSNSGTSSAMNSKANVDALQWYGSLVDKGCAETPPSGSSNVQEFANGRAAMIIESSTAIPYFQSLGIHMSWGIAPLPKGPTGHASNMTDAMGFAIYANSAVKKADWKLIRFLNGRYGMPVLDAASGYLPGRSSIRAASATAAFAHGRYKSSNWSWPTGLVVNAFPHVDGDIQASTTGPATFQSYQSDVSDMNFWIKQSLQG